MSSFSHTRGELTVTGSVARVPCSCKARLMYYLQTVSGLLRLDNPRVDRLGDYDRWGCLTEGETDSLLQLVTTLNPDHLIGKVMFVSDELCGDHNNNFYDISQVKHLFDVSDSIVVGGQQTQVVKVMTFKQEWVMANYFRPIQYYKRRLARIAAGLPGYKTPAQSQSATCHIL